MDKKRNVELNQQNIIIDEAQAYPDLFKVLRGVVDGKRGLKGRYPHRD